MASRNDTGGPSTDLVPLRRPDGRAIVKGSSVSRIRAIAEAIFATERGAPPGDRLDWLERQTEDFLARTEASARAMFLVMVWITSVAAPLMIRRFTSLASLDLDERIHALRVLEKRRGEPLLAVKAILCLIYYEHPDAAREVGFDGQCLRGERNAR